MNPRIILTSLLALLATGTAFAQTGEISGRVLDQAGAAVPGVKVAIIQTSTGTQRTIETNSDGFYTAPQLLPGPYTVAVEHAGFRPIRRSNLELQVDQNLRLDFNLQLGAVTEVVEVSAAAPLLETETSSIGQVVNTRDIVELPLLGRDAYALSELVPGVRTSRGMNDLPVDIISTASISINGAPAVANEFLLDGAPNTAAAANQPIIYPNADAVQEFRVETNNFSAEYGRAAGGVFNVVTKAGTNNFHGTAYEFFRNNVLNANNWFSNLAGQPIPPLKFNQFGGVFGGPVILPKYNGRNRTFFFVGAELVRFIQGVTFSGTVPNPAELSGNFSNDRNAAGQQITIYNPFSTAPNPSGSGFIRTPFANNIIPANLLSPIAAKLATYFPAPNTPGIGFTGTNNYIRSDSNNIHKDTFTTRFDHNFTDNTRIFGRYSYDDSPYVRASPYTYADPGSPGFGPQDFTRKNAVLEFDHIFSPTLISQFRLSFSRLANQRGPVSQGFDITQLGFSPSLRNQIGAPAAFPVIQITGYSPSSSIANQSGAYALGETGLLAVFANNFAVQGSVSKNLRSHEIKTGGEFRVIQLNTLQTADASTTFNFTSAFTQGPNPGQSTATAGDALASFLLGTPNAGSVAPSPALAMQTKYFAGFIQDNWKVTSRLTLNLGIRYEVETPRTERYNQFANFNYNAPSPLNIPGLNLKGALNFVGVNGQSRYDYNVDWNNVSPRLGFSWQAAPKTVVRGGGGIFYGNLWGISSSPNAYGIDGFTGTTSMVTSAPNGFTPLNTLANPYPSGLIPATGSSLGASTQLGQTIDFFDRSNVTPYSIQWNLDIQRELPFHFLMDVGYVGTHNLHEPGNLILNQLPPQDLALGNTLRNTVANPFFGQFTLGTLAQPTISQAQLLVPYPQYTGVTSNQANYAAGRYNALQVKLQKRFSKDLDMLISYTWSKLMDQANGAFTGETLGGGNVQNYYDLNAEWSPSLIDQTHRLIFNVVYGLPFYRAQHGISGRVLGGWELSVLGFFYSGSPLGITSAVNNTFSLGGGQRPNWNGVNPGLDNPSVTMWFNTSVFSAPPAYTFGTAPRTFDGARSDWTRSVDISLHKSVRLLERLTLQIRGEAFNLANTPIFGPPNTSFGSPSFGVVSAQSNQPRVLQLAMKLIF